MKLQSLFFLVLQISTFNSLSAVEQKVDGFAQCDEAAILDVPDPVKFLVKQSRYIGLYEAKLIQRRPDENEEMVGSEPAELSLREAANSLQRQTETKPQFDIFNLIAVELISGSPPDEMRTEAVDKTTSIPMDYFFLSEIHKNMVEKRTTFQGSSGLIIDSNGLCRAVPKFVDGYHYLILGGTSSIVSAEPILSRIHDPFYNKVKKLAEELQKP